MSTLRQRFMEKFCRDANGHWLWIGAKDKAHGYGYIGSHDTRKIARAHRIAWELFVGPIPSGLSVLHKCDKPECVNPKHLFLGTQADNIADMDTKGRRVKSKALHWTRLTDSERSAITNAVGTYEDIAERFGVSESYVWKLKKKERELYETDKELKQRIK